MSGLSSSEHARLVAEWQRQGTNIARDLHELANWVQNRSEFTTPTDLISSSTMILSRVTNTLPNLPLGQLFRAAHDADGNCPAPPSPAPGDGDATATSGDQERSGRGVAS